MFVCLIVLACVCVCEIEGDCELVCSEEDIREKVCERVNCSLYKSTSRIKPRQFLLRSYGIYIKGKTYSMLFMLKQFLMIRHYRTKRTYKCVRVREREREREKERACVCERERESECVCELEREIENVGVCVCVCL